MNYRLWRKIEEWVMNCVWVFLIALTVGSILGLLFLVILQLGSKM